MGDGVCKFNRCILTPKGEGVMSNVRLNKLYAGQKPEKKDNIHIHCNTKCDDGNGICEKDTCNKIILNSQSKVCKYTSCVPSSSTADDAQNKRNKKKCGSLDDELTCIQYNRQQCKCTSPKVNPDY